jgi:integrase
MSHPPPDAGRRPLKPAGSIRPLMYATLFGLLAATGMRISETLALLLGDVTTDGLIIRNTKFRKSRLLPLHDTTRQMLDDYLSARLRLGTLDGALFVSTTGKASSYSTAESIFLKLMRTIGVRCDPSQVRCRSDAWRSAKQRRSPCDACCVT